MHAFGKRIQYVNMSQPVSFHFMKQNGFILEDDAKRLAVAVCCRYPCSHVFIVSVSVQHSHRTVYMLECLWDSGWEYWQDVFDFLSELCSFRSSLRLFNRTQ